MGVYVAHRVTLNVQHFWQQRDGEQGLVCTHSTRLGVGGGLAVGAISAAISTCPAAGTRIRRLWFRARQPRQRPCVRHRDGRIPVDRAVQRVL